MTRLTDGGSPTFGRCLPPTFLFSSAAPLCQQDDSRSGWRRIGRTGEHSSDMGFELGTCVQTTLGTGVLVEVRPDGVHCVRLWKPRGEKRG